MRHFSGHIVLKGMLTIFRAPLLVPRLSPVLIHTDSLASVQILRSGYSRMIQLDRLSRVFWQLVSRRSLTLHLSFLPGNYNVRADQLSRGVAISTEWSSSD